MTRRRIRRSPDAVARRKARDTADVRAFEAAMAQDMLELMQRMNACAVRVMAATPRHVARVTSR
jgi:hypothetical protein